MKNKELGMKKLIKKALKLILPLVLGGFILYWVYRDFDFVKAATWHKLVVDGFLASFRHICTGISWLALAPDAGAFGSISPKKGLC